MTRQTILIAGGCGAVGQRMAADLAPDYPVIWRGVTSNERRRPPLREMRGDVRVSQSVGNRGVQQAAPRLVVLVPGQRQRTCAKPCVEREAQVVVIDTIGRRPKQPHVVGARGRVRS